ncbi:Angiopoietin-related protein 7 [Halocaridina rubra]|uniref:Angiopoietin-related protein 7 n=1 Tax=Halocaridina rubra TaxID=373956 RepID=A0AAN8XCK3_HALRR
MACICFLRLSMTFLLVHSSYAIPERPRKIRGQDTAELMKEIKDLQHSQKVLQEEIANLRRSMIAVEEMVTSSLPEDCSVSRARGSWASTAYVKPPGLSPRRVKCDQLDSGGGWTVMLARQYSQHPVDFNATWQQYKEGFGDITGEFWIGNEVLHALTKEVPHQLRALLTDWDGNLKTATWKYFKVGSEGDGYRLGVGDYQKGNEGSEAGDALRHHNNHTFSTHDRDGDADENHCARLHGGGWWYFRCYTANPTGKALLSHEEHVAGMIWRPIDTKKSLKSITMMIRPILARN